MTGRIEVGSARVPFALALCMLFTPCNWSHAKQQVTLAHGTLSLDSADAFSVLDNTTPETRDEWKRTNSMGIYPCLKYYKNEDKDVTSPFKIPPHYLFKERTALLPLTAGHAGPLLWPLLPLTFLVHFGSRDLTPKVRLQVIGIYETGYFVSLVALLISLATLSYFKALRCPRNTMHKNLFTSFAVNNFLWLLWYRLIVTDPEVINENGVGCQVLHVVLHYFLLTNYFWMLAEGFYLHTLLVSAFISEERLVRWLYVLGWVTPIPIILLYTALRLYYQATDQCWLIEGFMMVLIIPVSLSMALNLVFLCNIVRVLLIKLRAGPTHLTEARPSRTLLQAFRATLLLLPLLGLHYLLTPFRPPKGHPLEVIYDIMSSATASFQGLCVATLFCFCNGEVIAQVKRRWQFVVFRPRMNSYTATTVSFVRSTVVPLACEDNV